MNVHEEEHSGRPQEAITEQTVAKVEKAIQFDRRATFDELQEEVNVSRGTLFTIIHDHLGFSKICSRFVPRFLTPEMKERRLRACLENWDTVKNKGELFLKSIITVDETPLSLYIPESRKESKTWHQKGDAVPLKMRSGTSHRKALMLTVFWSYHGIHKLDFLPSGPSIDAEYYFKLIVDCSNQLRLDFPRKKNWFFLQDNAPIHTAHKSMETIASVNWTALNHPPYSPDLSPSDFALFTKLKEHLHGTHFDDANELEADVRQYFESLEKDFFENSFINLGFRWESCIGVSGSYFEK